MPSFPLRFSAPPTDPLPASERLHWDRWHRSAEADYRLCRLFADVYDARLSRSLRSQRVGWERERHHIYGILLPDALSSASLMSEDWYIYYVWGETLFRRSQKERQKLGMLVLPDSVEDWAELLRQAVRHDVFDVRYEVTPHYVNALGEVEMALSGYEFRLSSCAPPTAATGAFRSVGTGETPDAAARDACRRWLAGKGNDVAA